MEKTKVTMGDKNCTNCQFCGSTIAHARVITRICRLRPPSVSAALLQGPEGLVWNACTSWPTVTDTDWCNEFAARLN